MENIYLLYKLREVVNKLFNHYSSVVSEAKYKTIYGEGVRILTPKQMIQRLPTALAEIIYSLYWANKTTKKVYNIINNSIKL